MTAATGPAPAARSARRVLVADGGPPSALAVARSLVRAGYRVEVSRAGPGDRAPRTRGALSFPAPSPAADPSGFVDALLAAAATGDRPALVACTDAALLALEARRAEVDAATDALLPSPDALRSVLDKSRTLAAARRVGVRVPETFEARRGEDADRCPLPPPWVVKPVSSRWTGPDGPVRGAGPAFARSRERLRAVLADLEARGCPGALVQTWIPGTGRGVGVLLRDGKPAALFLHRRLREVHPAGGPSAAAVSEPPDGDLIDPAVRLLRELRFDGLAMVEFRRDGDGDPMLMEVNGRPWGTLGLAVDSGVDFPRLLVEGYAGPPPVWHAGTVRRWIAGDLRRTAIVARGAPEDYPGPFPSIWSAAALVLFSGHRDLVFRWSDPGPFLAELRGARG